uniref:DDE Tnp4 domain-containing protein n=1 Tax=Ditylenchus dipsaci TaxID=166011 RepID=A0A915ENN4_9BILA
MASLADVAYSTPCARLLKDSEACEGACREIYNIARFPNVVGIIDCTHIRILASPNAIVRDYVNRKNHHSINVQAVVDHERKFVNVVAKWQGCTHDSFILRHSSVWEAFESRQMTGIILGDSGYANRPWLMPPISSPRDRAEQRAHDKTRVLIEHTFGRWKRRFHSLHGELRIALQNVPDYIIVAAVLHNIAVDLKQPDFLGPEDDFIDDQPECPEPTDNICISSGNAYRNQIVQNYFA